MVGLFHKICSTKLSDQKNLLLGLYFIALAFCMCVFSSLPGNTHRGVLTVPSLPVLINVMVSVQGKGASDFD